jgi:hypothetical protein
VPSWDHPPSELPNEKDKGTGYIRGLPERGLRIGALLADGDVLQERGSRMLLDPGFSAPAFGKIPFHGCLKYKILRGHTKVLGYFYHSGSESQILF